MFMCGPKAPLTSNPPFSYHMSQLQTRWDFKRPGLYFFGYVRKLFSSGNHLGKSEGAYLQSPRRKGDLTPRKEPAGPAVPTAEQCGWTPLTMAT